MSEETKPARRIKWAALAAGFVLAGPAAAAAGLDIYSNIIFGMQRSLLIAGLFVVAGVGLVAFPCVARGRKDPIWLIVLLCAGVSIFAGVQNHRESQRNHALREQSATRAYEQAQKAIETAEADMEAATAEALRIDETMGSAELGRLYEDAKAAENSEAKEACGRRCRKARDDAAAYLQRKANAKAKEDAEARAVEARERRDAAKAASPAQAKATMTDEVQEFWLGIILVVMTVGCAPFFHRGWHEMLHAIAGEPVKVTRLAPRPRKAVEVERQADAEKRHDVAAFVQHCTAAGGEADFVFASAIYDELCSYFAMYNPGQPVPTPTALGRALGKKGAGYVKDKKGGNWGYCARLKEWKPAKPVVKVA